MKLFPQVQAQVQDYIRPSKRSDIVNNVELSIMTSSANPAYVKKL